MRPSMNFLGKQYLWNELLDNEFISEMSTLKLC